MRGSDTAVRFEQVSKKFCKSINRSMAYGLADVGRNVLGLSSRPGVLRKGEFFAVDGVSFELKNGETLGIIGLNGSGKSTLLKMAGGIFWPDRGRIAVNGKVGALIEVGAGFHPSLTGRENIYVNAAILGMTREETDRKFDEIVEFADIGDFLDVPVRHYSAGMFVRLGFSVAIHCEPDILLVDEVLSVGDARFLEKCQERIDWLLRDGVTLVLVSHNLRLIAALCSRTILLHEGKLVADADTHTTICEYEKLRLDIGQSSAIVPVALGDKCRISGLRVTDEEQKERAVYPVGGKIRCSFDYTLDPAVDLEKVHFSLGLLKDNELFALARYRSALDGLRLSRHRGRIDLLMNATMTSGNYFFEIVFVHDGKNVLAVQYTPRFKVMHPTLPWIDKEYFGQFVLEPTVRIYPLEP